MKAYLSKRKAALITVKVTGFLMDSFLVFPDIGSLSEGLEALITLVGGVGVGGEESNTRDIVGLVEKGLNSHSFVGAGVGDGHFG